MTPADRMGQIVVLSRRVEHLNRVVSEGGEHAAQAEGKRAEAQDAITDHLKALDAERWLDWCAGELETANLAASTFGMGSLD